MDIDRKINMVRDPMTRRALRQLWDQLYSDAAANKTVFDAHTHRQQLTGAGVTACLSSAGLAIDANPEDVQCDRYVDFIIAGVLYHAAIDAAIDISALAFTATTLATNTSRAYLLTIVAAGTLDIVEGADLTGSAQALAVVPDTPASECGIGVILVGNKGVAAFKLGSDDLGSATDYNVTYVNIAHKEPVITSKPGSDAQDNTAGTAVTHTQSLTT